MVAAVSGCLGVLIYVNLKSRALQFSDGMAVECEESKEGIKDAFTKKSSLSA